MNKILVLALVFSVLFGFGQQANVEFTKKNFTDKEGLQKALKNIHHGNELYKAAFFYYENEDFSHFRNALPFYSAAYDFNPNNAELNYKIGVCVLHTIHNEQALKYLIKAKELDPKVNPELEYYLGRANHFNENWDEAIADYKEYELQQKQGKLSKFEQEELEADIAKKVKECEFGKEFSSKPVNVVIQNLGEPINSEYPEYGVVISADESVMYFTARRPGSHGSHATYRKGHEENYHEDIYRSVRSSDGTWSKPENLGHPINSSLHDATVGLSPDGQIMLVYKSDHHLGGIYHCDLEGDEWGAPLPIKVIDTDAHESSACYSPDQQTLYYVTDLEKGSQGGKDIFYTTWNKEEEKWNEPQNLGDEINTPYDEEAVFMHSDGRTLYFSSRGHNSMGGFDVFKTVLQPNNTWSPVENLGYPVNGPEDDVFLVMAANGRHAYYATHHKDSYGEKDIYKIIFLGDEKELVSITHDPLLAGTFKPMTLAIPDPNIPLETAQTTILKGVVRDAKSGKPLAASIEIIDNKTHEVVGVYKSNSKTGKYLVSLPSGKNYGITVDSDSTLFHSENVDIPITAAYNEIYKDINLSKIEVGSRIVLKNVFFDSRESKLRDESIPELQRLILILKDHPQMTVEISGHTDNIGSEDYNAKLSQDRAISVVDYLVRNGIEISRLSSIGYGFSKPIATNDTVEGRQLNRRTEFKIIGK